MKSMHRPLPAAMMAVALLALGCDAAPPPATTQAGPQPQSLPTTSITVNGTPLTLQIADTEATREIGLMHTHQMPADHGMIFVFPGEGELGFWMKNTPIDLDIVYADHTGRVMSVKTMKAFDLTNIPSDGAASYAIELNAGVAAKLNLVAGQHVEVPATLLKNAK